MLSSLVVVGALLVTIAMLRRLMNCIIIIIILTCWGYIIYCLSVCVSAGFFVRDISDVG